MPPSPKHLETNPRDSTRVPRGPRVRNISFLAHEDFALLHSKVTEFWQPLVEFAVASGARWGELAALRPSDVNRAEGTVRIERAWRSGDDGGGYWLDAPKTPKSRRTIVPAQTLDKLDYSNEWLFVNRDERPARSHSLIRHVWAPAVERTWPTITDDEGKPVADNPSRLRPTVHDLRHTCAGWMILEKVPLPGAGTPRPRKHPDQHCRLRTSRPAQQEVGSRCHRAGTQQAGTRQQFFQIILRRV